MSLYWAFKRFTMRKLKTVSGYIEFLKNTDMSKVPPISIGDTDKLEEADYNNLFSYLKEYDLVKQKYSVQNIFNGDNDFERVISVMQWLTDVTWYSGQQHLFHKFLMDDTPSILDFGYKKSFEFAINCRYKAIALTDILIALGMKAYPVCMIDSANDGNHFTVHVYLCDEKKWILLDPSFNTYFTDNSNNVLNAVELRSYFIDGKEPVIHGYSFNGTTECIDIYKEVFIKSALTNLTTWHDNSDIGRNTTDMDKRKKFECKLPEI